MKPPTRCGRVHFEHRHRKWLVITVRPTTSVRESPQKNLPLRNTPDSFCRRFTPTKSIAALLGRYFSLWETYLENFISRPDVIPTFRQRRCKTGAGTSFGANGDPLHEQSPSTYFCALTIRKHLSKVDFERSGRGQEPSRGHKFSILENVVLHRDFTSASLASFDVILLGCACPKPCSWFAPCGAKERRVALT